MNLVSEHPGQVGEGKTAEVAEYRYIDVVSERLGQVGEGEREGSGGRSLGPRF